MKLITFENPSKSLKVYIDDDAFSLFDYTLNGTTQDQLISKLLSSITLIDTNEIYISRIAQYIDHYEMLLSINTREIRIETIAPTNTSHVFEEITSQDVTSIGTQFLIPSSTYTESFKKKYDAACTAFQTSKKDENVISLPLPPKPVLSSQQTVIDTIDTYIFFDRGDAPTALMKGAKLLKAKAKQKLIEETNKLLLTINQESKGIKLKGNARLNEFIKRLRMDAEQKIAGNIDNYSNDFSNAQLRLSTLNEFVLNQFKMAHQAQTFLTYYKQSLILALYAAANNYYIYLQKTEDNRKNIIESINKLFAPIIHISRNGVPKPIDYVSTCLPLKYFEEMTQSILHKCQPSGYAIKSDFVAKSIKFFLDKINTENKVFTYNFHSLDLFTWSKDVSNFETILSNAHSLTSETIDRALDPDLLNDEDQLPEVRKKNREIIDESYIALNKYYALLNQAIECISNSNNLINNIFDTRNKIDNISKQLTPNVMDAFYDLLIIKLNTALSTVKKTHNELTQPFTNFDHDSTALTKSIEEASTLKQTIFKIEIEMQVVLTTYELALQAKQIEEREIVQQHKLLETKLKAKQPAAIEKRAPIGFLDRHLGKFVGSILFTAAFGFAGGVIGAILAPFTFGVSLAIGITIGVSIGATVGAATGCIAGSVADSCINRFSTADIYNSIEGKPQSQPIENQTSSISNTNQKPVRSNSPPFSHIFKNTKKPTQQLEVSGFSSHPNFHQ